MARGESRRSVRMADMIMREIGSMLVEDIQDPRLDLVTVSGVRLNADLRVALVLFTVHGGKDVAEAALAGFKKAGGYLRSGLGRRMKLKFVPELRFKHDDFLEDMVYAQGTGHGLPNS